jgi:tripartite motif-containing protein 71
LVGGTKSDAYNNRIQTFSAAGIPLAQWGRSGVQPGEFGDGELGGLAIDTQGDIYAGDTGNNRIQRLSPSGQYLAQWAAPGGKLGYFSGHTEIAIDTRGNL